MFQTVRGTFDVLPEAQGARDGAAVPAVPGSAAWRHVEGVVRASLSRFGFEEIRTPILEPLGLVARGVGATTDIVQKEMFVVPRGGDDFVLRPEVTAPVMRAYLQHRLDQRGTQRLYYLGPCFRAERPQKGRFRQFHQFGIELLGPTDARADAEAVAALVAIYAQFGLTGLRLRLNTLGDAADRPRYREALQAYFEPYRADLSETSRQRLDANPLRLLDTKDERERRLLDDAPRISDHVGPDARAHDEAVRGLLDDLGVAYVVDPLLVRGLDYYTRTVFEVEHNALGAQGALGAGGRYDGLAEAVGSKKPVPAVGWAAGIERLFLALNQSGYVLPSGAPPDAAIIALGPEAEAWAFAQAQKLRTDGFAVVFDLTSGRSLKAQLKEAARLDARFTVIVGSDELAAQAAAVRDMASGEQRAVSFDALAEAIRPAAPAAL